MLCLTELQGGKREIKTKEVLLVLEEKAVV
jgi:hypothetical protein